MTTTTSTRTAATPPTTNGKRKIRGLIFDMDGTLTVPNLDFNEMMRRLGCKTNNILKEVDGFDEERRKKSYQIIAEMEGEALKTMKAMPGAVKLAKLLDDLNVPRGLVTRNVKTSVDHFHNVAWKDGETDTLMKAFHPVCSREFTPYKPAPDSLLHICKEWGVDPSEVMMVGDKRKYNVALITLKAVGANGEVPGTDNLDAGAARLNPDVKTISAAMDDPKWIEAITQAITATNKNPKVCINNAFSIQKFTILPTNFSEEANQLTPTKKLKRAVVEKQYKDLIEKMYATNGTYIRYSE